MQEAAWHLSHIVVTNLKSGQSWLFPCHKWLGGVQGQGVCQRTLPLAGGCRGPCIPASWCRVTAC